MSQQIALILGACIGILAFGLGVAITYKKFNKTKSYLEVEVLNSEKELEQDLKDITEIELSKTQAGRELSLILFQKTMRSFEKSDTVNNQTYESINRNINDLHSSSMAQKEKSREELLIELRELRKTALTSSVTEILSVTIKYSALTLCVYFFSTTLMAFIGQQTSAVIADFRHYINVAVILFGAMGASYGLIERRIRQKMIKRFREELARRSDDTNKVSSNIAELGDND